MILTNLFNTMIDEYDELLITFIFKINKQVLF